MLHMIQLHIKTLRELRYLLALFHVFQCLSLFLIQTAFTALHQIMYSFTLDSLCRHGKFSISDKCLSEFVVFLWTFLKR